ncbi:MAG: hypothetical protein CUN52_13510, partial [Phototrophicales bacterium]
AYRRLMHVLAQTQSGLAQVATTMRAAEEQAGNLFKSSSHITATDNRFNGFSGGGAGGGRSGGFFEYKDGGLYGEDNRPFNGNPDVIFIPGISTDPKGFEDHIARTNNNYPPNMQIAAIYNKSDGFLADINQAMGDRSDAKINNRFGDDNPAVENLKNQVRQAILDGRPLRLEAHSQGGAITSAALMDLYRENPNYDFSKITVKTFGSAGTEFPPGPRYTHYVVAGDPVPLVTGIDDSMGSVLASSINPVFGAFSFAHQFLSNREYYANIVVVPPGSTGNPISDFHGMETYNTYSGMTSHTPMSQQIVNTVMDLSNKLLNTSNNIYNSLKTVFGGQ